jgi:hypothetical protein
MLTVIQDLTGQVAKNPHIFAMGGFSDVYEGTWTRPDGTTERV